MSDLMTRKQWYALAQKALAERDEAYCDTDALRTDLAAATSRAEQAEAALRAGDTHAFCPDPEELTALVRECEKLNEERGAARGERDRLLEVLREYVRAAEQLIRAQRDERDYDHEHEEYAAALAGAREAAEKSNG